MGLATLQISSSGKSLTGSGLSIFFACLARHRAEGIVSLQRRKEELRGLQLEWDSAGKAEESPIQIFYRPDSSHLISRLRRNRHGSPKAVAQNHGLGNVFHRFPPFLALPLHHPVSGVFAEFQVSLQNAFGALDGGPCLQFAQQESIFTFQPRPFDFSAHQKPKGRDQADFPFAVLMARAILCIDNANQPSPRQDWDREECFEAVFRQFVEELKSRILVSAVSNRHGPAVFGHPSGNPLPNFHFQAIYNLRMGVFRRPEDQLVPLQHIDEAGIALHHRRHKFNDHFQDFSERHGLRYSAGRGVQKGEIGGLRIMPTCRGWSCRVNNQQMRSAVDGRDAGSVHEPS
jgi:hypothetical protein